MVNRIGKIKARRNEQLETEATTSFWFHRTTVFFPKGDIRANQAMVQVSYSEK